ncbi:MAG: MMPL family transporter [Nocardioides sp.]|nr:MMPL family transporter [Nocardioides sp.]
MATLLYRLGRTAYRRWPVVVAAWLVALIAVGAFAGLMSKPMSDSFSLPGIPSERAATLQEELFTDEVASLEAPTVTVVVAAPEGERLDTGERTAQVDALIAEIGGIPQMPAEPGLANPVQAGPALEAQLLEGAQAAGTDPATARDNAAALTPLSADGRIGTMSFTFDAPTTMDVEPETRDALAEVIEEAEEGSDLQVDANGPGMATASPPDASAEAIGIAVALVILVITFGSLVAAGLPIVAAVVGVGLSIGAVTGASAFVEVSSTTPILGTMLGLAVGIDYTLFILARYRAELDHTDDRQEATGIAVGTAGSAVVFAGLTVMIALGALAVVRIPFLTSMGVAAAGAVAVGVLVALTLLPAMLGMLKSKTFGGQVRRYRPTREDDGRILNTGVRWARTVRKAPLAVLVVVVLVLGALAVPIQGLHLAFPTDSTAPADTTQREASDLVAEGFGPGREAPMLVVVDGRDLTSEEAGAAFAQVAAWAGDRPDVANAQVVGVNEAGTGASVLVTPAYGPDRVETQEVLESLRAEQSAIEEQTGATTGVTGLTAITTDISDRLSGAMPLYLTVVVGLAFLLLMLVFRSVLVPLTATVGFLLSVLATLGATVLVFQEGLFGLVDPQPIVSFIPIFVIGIVFGLAMDYQVFLVTRMREAHVHGMSARDAVVDGFRNSARVVTAAALIMTSVFAAFMLMDDPIIKSMGFALAVAVLLDAFLIRMAFIPALMYLIGERVWRLPGWLDRLLPEVDVEGEKLERPHLQQQREPEPVGAGRA